jgi:hypothetical protein
MYDKWKLFADLTKGLMVVVTNSPLFHQKAALFPECTMVVGYDTAIRIVNVGMLC